MRLIEALEIANRPADESSTILHVSLICGFTPLHLQTFLSAHLRVRFPEKGLRIKAGLFGDLAGNLERLELPNGSAACVAVEWTDLDPRLGLRSLGSWRADDIPDIVRSAWRQSGRLIEMIERVRKTIPLCVSAPTLPLPPIFITGPHQAKNLECELRQVAAFFAASISADSGIKLVNTQQLDEVSPFGRRFDPKAELNTGFPYTLEHASSLAEIFAALLSDSQPAKGLITDLDDTFWAGTLGDDGIEGVAWDTASGAHLHGLYQRFLDSLASAGALLAVASKNDPALVEQALQRRDILLTKDRIFPIEAHWSAKSKSIRKILDKWNVSAAEVVFVDDSPMEVAEVKSVFPDMESIIFPRADPSAVWGLLRHLRDRFGKSHLSEEDALRLNSIRSAETLRAATETEGHGSDDFLRDAEARITFSSEFNRSHTRALELINKTNQFNLNGRRLVQSEWIERMQRTGSFLVTAAYEDKYGPLGEVAVIFGTREGATAQVESWVMSCRAFSRRIEHQCMNYLFKRLGADEIVLDFVPTPRNRPIRDFLGDILGSSAQGQVSVSRDLFYSRVPPLFHKVGETNRV